MAAHQMKRAFADTPDGQMHYRVAGEGDPLIMLHQVPLSSLEFIDVQLPLAEKRRVIAPDLLGYGCSDAPSRGMTIADYATSIISLMNEMRIERTDLLGVHTGGAVANEIAAAYPERVNRLIIVGAPDWDTWQHRYESFARCHPFELDAEGASIKEQWARLARFTNDDKLIRRFISEKLKASPIWYVAYVAVFTYDFRARFTQVKAPLLFLVGSGDILVERTAPLKKIRPDAQEVVVEGATSWLAWEQPNRFIVEVERFLSTAG